MLPNANQRFSQRKKEISLNYLEKQQSDLNNIHSFPSSLEDQASCFSGMLELLTIRYCILILIQVQVRDQGMSMS